MTTTTKFNIGDPIVLYRRGDDRTQNRADFVIGRVSHIDEDRIFMLTPHGSKLYFGCIDIWARAFQPTSVELDALYEYENEARMTKTSLYNGEIQQGNPHWYRVDLELNHGKETLILSREQALSRLVAHLSTEECGAVKRWMDGVKGKGAHWSSYESFGPHPRNQGNSVPKVKIVSVDVV